MVKNECVTLTIQEKRILMIHNLNERKENDMTDLKKELVDLIGTGRPKKILIERANGTSLDDIGLKFQITRERARQIEAKPKQQIKDWLLLRKKEMLEMLSDNGVVVNKEKANIFFGEENFKILCYCVHERRRDVKNNGWFLMPEMGTIAFSEDMEFYKVFYGLIEKCKNGEIMLKEISEESRKAGYSFVDECFIDEFIKNSGYKVYDGRIFERKLTIGKAIVMAAKERFKDGVKITDNSQLEEFAKCLNENYGQNVKAGRALTARIQNTLVMYRRGTYVNPENIKRDDVLDESIKENLRKAGCLLSYMQIYQMLDKQLLEDNGLFTKENLSGYLRSNEKKLGIRTNRYYVEMVSDEPEIEHSKEYFQQMVDYLMEAGGAVSTDKILKDLLGWNELYPKYAMFYFPQIVQWNPKEYLNLDIFDFDKESCDKIHKVVTKKLKNDLGYANAFVIFKEVQKNYPEIIKKFDIRNENHMFYVVRYAYYLNGWTEAGFRKPHIYKGKDIGKLSTEKIIDMLASKNDIISKEFLSEELFKYYGRKNNSLFLAIQKAMRKYARISQDEYTEKKNIFIRPEDAEQIKAFIFEQIEKDGYLIPITCNEEYKKLPKPRFKDEKGKEFEWNSWLLITVSDALNLPVKVLNRRNNASQNTMIMVDSNSKLNSKEDFVLWILKEKFPGNDILSREAYDFLHNLDIFAANYPYQEMKKFVEKAISKAK